MRQSGPKASLLLSPSSLHRVEGLVEVDEDVGDVLDADAEAEKAVADAGGGALLGERSRWVDMAG